MEIKDVELHKARPKLKDVRRTPVTIHASNAQADFLGEGIEGYVTRVSTPIRGKIVDGLAYKEYHEEGRAAHALKAWLRLRDARVPVPSTFRLVMEGEKYAGILMTDLTKGWKDLFITSNQTKGYMIDQTQNHNPTTVEAFKAMNLDDAQLMMELDEKLAVIAERSARGRIEFMGGDVISAIIKSGKSIDLVISDMGNVKVDSDRTYEYLLEENKSAISSIKLMIYEAQRLAKEL